MHFGRVEPTKRFKRVRYLFIIDRVLSNNENMLIDDHNTILTTVKIDLIIIHFQIRKRISFDI